MDMNSEKRYKILNTYVDTLTMEETINKVINIIDQGIPTQHVVINASKVMLMEKDRKLNDIVNSCPIINADGASIVLAAKFLGVPVKERVTGIDLFLNLVKIASEQQYKVYLLGATDQVVKSVKEKLSKAYPNLQIVGYDNGYFNKENENDIIERIRNSGADMLFVAFSSPKKEYWLYDNISFLNVPFVMGVGGSFDVVAGKTKRAPVWMQKSGLEWFYRFIQEPKRMWKRYLVGNFKFLFVVLKYKFKK